MESRGGIGISRTPLTPSARSWIKARASSIHDSVSRSTDCAVARSRGAALFTSSTLAVKAGRVSPSGSRGQMPVNGFSKAGFLAS